MPEFLKLSNYMYQHLTNMLLTVAFNHRLLCIGNGSCIHAGICLLTLAHGTAVEDPYADLNEVGPIQNQKRTSSGKKKKDNCKQQ